MFYSPGLFQLRLGSLMLDFGNGDAIHLENFDPDDVAGGGAGIDQFVFNGGFTLAYKQLTALGFDLEGTPDADVIQDTSASDRINAFAGDDLVMAKRGEDVIDLGAGEGNDVAYGGEGADLIFGEAGDDILDGGAGDDILDGGSGADFMAGGSGNDTYSSSCSWLTCLTSAASSASCPSSVWACSCWLSGISLRCRRRN